MTIQATDITMKAISGGFLTQPDSTPDQFTFIDQTNVTTNALTESSPIVVTGMDSFATAPISINVGEYQIDLGLWFSTPGTVSDGQSIKVRHTASSIALTATNSILTIGGVSDTFTTVTASSSSNPTYSPQLLSSFQGPDGDPLSNASPSFTSHGPIDTFTNEVTGPFGATTTGRFNYLTSDTAFGGRWTILEGQTTPEGSDTWFRWYENIPTSFCSGFGSQPDGFGRTKWITWRYNPGIDVMWLQLERMNQNNCNTGTSQVTMIQIGFPSDQLYRPQGGAVAVNYPRDTWVSCQVRVHHSTDPNVGFAEFWENETYLGRAQHSSGSLTMATIPVSSDSLHSFRIGDHWNGGIFQNSHSYKDEFIWYNATGNPPNTVDSGGRPYISPSHQVSDFP